MHVLNLRVHIKKINLQISGRKPWLRQLSEKRSIQRYSRLFFQPGITWEWQRGFKKNSQKEKKEKKKEKKRTKMASPPVQDFYPDSDRNRGTMLYPLSCGELAMNGE